MADILTELGEEEQRKQKLAEVEAEKENKALQRVAQEKALQGFEKLEIRPVRATAVCEPHGN